MTLSNASYRAVETGAVGGWYYSRPNVARMGVRPSFPPQVSLAGDLFDKYSLIQPITVSLGLSDGRFLVSDDVFYMYGEGITLQAAIEDYLSSLAEYYELLESYDDAPSLDLFSYLQTYLRPRTT